MVLGGGWDCIPLPRQWLLVVACPTAPRLSCSFATLFLVAVLVDVRCLEDLPEDDQHWRKRELHHIGCPTAAVRACGRSLAFWRAVVEVAVAVGPGTQLEARSAARRHHPAPHTHFFAEAHHYRCPRTCLCRYLKTVGIVTDADTIAALFEQVDADSNGKMSLVRHHTIPPPHPACPTLHGTHMMVQHWQSLGQQFYLSLWRRVTLHARHAVLCAQAEFTKFFFGDRKHTGTDYYDRHATDHIHEAKMANIRRCAFTCMFTCAQACAATFL